MRKVWLFLVIFLVCVLPAVAGASEEQESRFFWHPSVRLGVDVNDNAELTRGKEEDDTSVRIRPSLELGYQSASLDAGAQLGVDFRRHTQDDSLNDTFYVMRGHAEAGLLPGLTLGVKDDYVPQAIELGVPEDHVANLAQTNRAAAELRYWLALGDRNELSMGVSATRLDADTVTTLVPGAGGVATPGRFRADHWEGGGFVQLGRNLGDRGQLFARGQAQHRSFEEIDDASLSDFSGVVGVDLRSKSGLSMRLEGGGGVTDFEGGPSKSRFDGRADLGYRLSRWRFGLGVTHGLATDLVGNAFTNLAGRLVVERSFGSRTRATLTGFGSLLDAASQATEGDGFGGAEFRIRRQLSREFSADVSYRFWENAGSRSDNDFRQHRGYFELRYLY
jgi:hypothetical protein